ncbi:hypothetical protein [Nocardia pseudobrasiliensis]|uniref:Cell division protein FtsB n=1 Tax=Nocardia pseudobrasiliensis TaxID=45979 RepID=A0A370I3J6_9NOCA|nr:hypothetical protein [Nocardia pseudobrasiliensis]RDI65312.1 hypothetical protein DFR76_106182 [Nocardia pseudobrasiliensis]
MSVRTRVDAPDRGSRRSAQPAQRQAAPAAPRRAESADRVKSGAAQRAYARRRNRVQSRGDSAPLSGRAASAMAGRLPFVTGIMALLGCGLALTLLLTTRAAEDSYQLGDARRLNRQLVDERAALQREVEAADSAPELASRARELGMIPAKDPVRLVVAPDGTVTVIGKEVPAEGPPVPPLNPSPTSAAAPPPNLVQAQGERVVPVTTTPKPAPNAPAGQPNPAVQAAAAGQGATPGQAAAAGQAGAAGQAAVPGQRATQTPGQGTGPAPAAAPVPPPAPGQVPAAAGAAQLPAADPQNPAAPTPLDTVTPTQPQPAPDGGGQ